MYTNSKKLEMATNMYITFGMYTERKKVEIAGKISKSHTFQNIH